MPATLSAYIRRGANATALELALERQARLLGRRELVSALIGGDEPAPPPHEIAALIGLMRRHWQVTPETETTLELTPPLPAWLDDYRAAGVTRLSLRGAVLDAGIQGALAEARKSFATVALDLAFGRPGQTRAAWGDELEEAVRCGADHVSIEEHQATDDPDHLADLYLLALDRLERLGLPPYEIAHFARPGWASRHLLHGARGGDYLGIGPGAIGRIACGGERLLLTQIASEREWIEAIEAGGDGVAERRVIGAEEWRSQLLMTGLRLRAGVERAWFEPLIGVGLERALAPSGLDQLAEDGFLLLDDVGLRLSKRGWPICDAVLRRLLP